MSDSGFVYNYVSTKKRGNIIFCVGNDPISVLFSLNQCSAKLQAKLMAVGDIFIDDPDCDAVPGNAVHVEADNVSTHSFSRLRVPGEPASVPIGGGNFDDLLAPAPLPHVIASPVPAAAPPGPAAAPPLVVSRPPTVVTYTAREMQQNSHFFMFSDNWEEIDQVPPGQQCLCAHQHESDDAVTYRVLLWHLNGTGNPLAVGVTLENTGDSPLLTRGLRLSQSLHSGDYFAAGRQLAKDVLAGSLTPVGEVVIKPGKIAELTVATIAANANFHQFCLLEFELVSSSRLSYTLRAAADKTSIVKRTGTPVAAHPPGAGPWRGHARGVWPYNAIEVRPDQAIDVSNDLPAILTLTEHRNAPSVAQDVALFAAAHSVALGESRANRGLYGVDLFLKLPLVNTTSTERVVPVTLRTPFDDGINGYTGAFLFKGQVGVVSPGDNRTHIGKMNPRSQKILSITVPPKTFLNAPFEASIRLHHGGTSTLPVELVLG